MDYQTHREVFGTPCIAEVMEMEAEDALAETCRETALRMLGKLYPLEGVALFVDSSASGFRIVDLTIGTIARTAINYVYPRAASDRGHGCAVTDARRCNTRTGARRRSACARPVISKFAVCSNGTLSSLRSATGIRRTLIRTVRIFTGITTALLFPPLSAGSGARRRCIPFQ